MMLAELETLFRGLELDEKHIIAERDGVTLFVVRPSKPNRALKHKYDPYRNIQIWMKEGGLPEFRPNHLRVLIDLNFRTRANPEATRSFLKAFDEIHGGRDPQQAIMDLPDEDGSFNLSPLWVTALLAQMFYAEQRLYYPRESKFDPPSLFLHGWVRAFINHHKALDIMCMSVARYQPPPAKYTRKENRKSRHFDPSAGLLWYL